MPELEMPDWMAKQYEGFSLGMGALAEFLQKQEQRQLEIKKSEAATAEIRKQEDFRKQIVTEVIKELSPVLTKSITETIQKQTQDLHGDQSHSVTGKYKWPAFEGKGDDESSKAKLRSDTTEVQKPIQAMEKHMIMDEQGHEHGHAEEEKEVMEETPMEAPVDEVPVEEEYPKEEEEDLDEMKAMYKAMKSVQKELSELKKSMPIEIQKQAKVLADTQLKQMGWNKEQSRSPKRTGSPLGLNDPAPIKKGSNPDDVVEELAKLSFSELGGMYIAKKSGITDGLPKELLG